jgi:propionyl-CoA synthetase
MTYQKEYQNSLADPVAYWQEQAKAIDWFTFPATILNQEEDELYRWYKGGKMNTSYLALDYHVANGRADQTALIYDSPVTNTKAQYTYQALLDETARFAGVLQAQGVEKGDRVIIYMPMIPQVVLRCWLVRASELCIRWYLVVLLRMSWRFALMTLGPS